MNRLSAHNVKKGDTVLFKREYMNDGDESLHFIAVDDMQHGRVSVQATNSGLNFPPVETVSRHMLSLPIE